MFPCESLKLAAIRLFRELIHGHPVRWTGERNNAVSNLVQKGGWNPRIDLLLARCGCGGGMDRSFRDLASYGL